MVSVKVPGIGSTVTFDVSAPLTIKPAGEAPHGREFPAGCAFRDRCAYAQAGCAAAVPALETAGTDHTVACHRRRELVYS